MQACQICGRSFDPLAFQVVVPELGRGFDRIECARSARALALPEGTIAAGPLVAIVEPGSAGLVPAVASTSAVRPVAAPVATLGLLAAGTAVAVVLWLRAFGADTTSFPLSRAAAPPAFGHETVQAQVQPRPLVAGRPAPRPAAAPVAAVLAARRQPAATFAPGTEGRRPAVVGRPAPPAGVARLAPAGHETGNGPVTGKGHLKHGETDGVHSPGHGRSHGKAKGNGKRKH